MAHATYALREFAKSRTWQESLAQDTVDHEALANCDKGYECTVPCGTVRTDRRNQ
jgi:hypothetical protein